MTIYTYNGEGVNPIHSTADSQNKAAFYLNMRQHDRGKKAVANSDRAVLVGVLASAFTGYAYFVWQLIEALR